MPHAESFNRRQALTWASAAVLGAQLPEARAQTKKRPTPAQTEGPFYPVRIPRDADFDLLKNGALSYAAGRAAWVEGVVSDLDGKPLKGGTIEIWQCDADGHYDHPQGGARADPAFQGFGRVLLDAQGAFRFRTIQPVAYSGRTPHIHAKLKLGQRELLTTQLYVAGDPGNMRDGVFRSLDPLDQAAVSSAFVPGVDGLRARYALAVGA
jgi:protocatechuate 3,4-dioxygenase beta subunit